MESLEAAINCWENALEAYQQAANGSLVAALLTKEEAEFCRSLERVLKAAYALQDETEHLFLHQVIFFSPSSIFYLDVCPKSFRVWPRCVFVFQVVLF